MENNSIKQNLFELYRSISNRKNGQLCSIGPFEYVSQLNSAWPKMVYLKNQEYKPVDEELKELGESVKKGECTPTLLLDSLSVTDEMQNSLREAGFLPVAQWVNMQFELRNNLQTIHNEDFKVNVLDAGDNRSMTEWLQIVNEVLFPGQKLDIELFADGVKQGLFTVLTGYYQLLPAATLLVFHGKEAGIYMVAVLPAFRKKGLGKLLMQEVHAMLSVKGYKRAVLHSTKQGLPLYQSLGYQPTGKIILFTSHIKNE
jgi:ribosomal protein S18 acetylase RimI-like enzyme